jgi:hypothetical protein
VRRAAHHIRDKGCALEWLAYDCVPATRAEANSLMIQSTDSHDGHRHHQQRHQPKAEGVEEEKKRESANDQKPREEAALRSWCVMAPYALSVAIPFLLLRSLPLPDRFSVVRLVRRALFDGTAKKKAPSKAH